MKSHPSGRRTPGSGIFAKTRKRLRIPVLYGIFGAAWIFFSDRALAAIVRNPDALSRLQTYKGWFFILVTAVLLALLVRRDQKSMEKLNDDLEDLVAEKAEELKKSLDAVVRNERMAALGGLVAGFSHEISTPIGNALVAVTHLEEIQEKSEVPEEDKARLLTGSAVRNLEKAVALIKSFKSVTADQTSGPGTAYSLSEVVRDTVATMGTRLRKADIHVDIDVPVELRLQGDPGVFFQIITNLVDNSIKHGYPGLNRRGTIRIRASFTGDEAVIEYCDDGVGLAESVRRRVFEPFSTTARNTGAAGLGMYIVYNAVINGLRGRIDSGSDGNGVRFVIAWPLPGKKGKTT